MRAILLAAGVGSRLLPLTATVPKCLLPINGRPLLRIWFELLEAHGVTDALINTHHLAEEVSKVVRTWQGALKLHLVYETDLRGSAGTLQENWDFVSGEDQFFACNADNLTDINLSSLVTFHRSVGSIITMALFRTDRPCECGIVEIDDTGLVQSFSEKPECPRSNLANGGVYVMDRRVCDVLPRKRPADIAFDLIPRCMGEVYGWKWDGVLLDIGTPASYMAAQEIRYEWRR
jgi:mannose-1-phosphate guanylyltransferase